MSMLPDETDDQIRGLKWQLMTAEARIVQLEALIQQYEEKLKLARLITWRDGDEGLSPLASPVPGDKPPLTSQKSFPASASAEAVTRPIRSIDPIERVKFQAELKTLLNKYGLDSEVNTPDDVLANYLVKCFEAFEFTELGRSRAMASTNPQPTGEPKL
jgi:hypothetical protein